ncbi:MAG TPA: MFS transporter [Herpetosiphonaceae bacterium]
MDKAPPAPPGRVRPPMLPIYICIAVTSLGIGLVNPLIPYLLQENGANEFIIGLTTSVMFASLVLTAWPIGRGIDRFGIRPFFALGLLCYSTAMALMPWAHRIGYFFILRALEGVGWSAVWTAAETYVSQASDPERRGHNMAVYGMSLATGTAMGPLIGTVLWKVSEPLPFMLAVVLALAAGALVLMIVPEPRLHHDDDHAQVGGISFSLMKPLLLPLVIAFLYGFGTLTLIALVPTLNYDEFQIGVLITVTVIANIAAQVPVGRLLDRFGYRPILLSSLSLLAGAALLSTLHPPFLVLLFLGSLLGAFAGTLYPIGLTILGSRIPPAKLGGASGLFNVCYGLGSVIGPAATGLLMTTVGKEHNDQALFGIIGCLVFTLLVFMLLGLDRFGAENERPVSAAETPIRPPH